MGEVAGSEVGRTCRVVRRGWRLPWWQNCVGALGRLPAELGTPAWARAGSEIGAAWPPIAHSPEPPAGVGVRFACGRGVLTWGSDGARLAGSLDDSQQLNAADSGVDVRPTLHPTIW